MSDRVVMIFGEGPHEIGREYEKCLTTEDGLPALPRLVDRLLGSPEGVSYRCFQLKRVRHVHHGRSRSGLARKATEAIRLAAAEEDCVGAVIAVDRDRERDAVRIGQLREGRDAAASLTPIPAAVGAPVETFDAWMIADAKAMRAAGTGEEAPHPNPEGLNQKEGTGGNHPKDYAGSQFGGKQGLGAKYAVIAHEADLEQLRRVCRRGFAPFAREVCDRIGPVVV